jgi:hypothetical protein
VEFDKRISLLDTEWEQRFSVLEKSVAGCNVGFTTFTKEIFSDFAKQIVSSWRGEEAEKGEWKRKKREIRQVRCLFNFFLGFSGTVSRCLYTSIASSRSYLGYHSITRPDHLIHCGPITLEFGFLWRFSISGLPPCFFSSALLFLASIACLLWLLLTQIVSLRVDYFCLHHPHGAGNL